MSGFRRLAAALVFVLVGGDCALAEDVKAPSDANPPANFKIDVARGDRWIYEARDEITDELKTIVDVAVSDVTDGEIDTRSRFTNASTNAESTSVQIYDSNWHGKDNGAATFRPPQPETGVPAEIQVGKTWSYAFELSRINPPAHFKFAGAAKVESWERVSVANGLAFDAFKIVYNSAVTPVVNNRKYEYHIELWYAPVANRYVKRLSETRQNGKLSESTLEILRDYHRRAQ